MTQVLALWLRRYVEIGTFIVLQNTLLLTITWFFWQWLLTIWFIWQWGNKRIFSLHRKTRKLLSIPLNVREITKRIRERLIGISTFSVQNLLNELPCYTDKKENCLFVPEIAETLGLNNWGKPGGLKRVFHSWINFKIMKEIS